MAASSSSASSASPGRASRTAPSGTRRPPPRPGRGPRPAPWRRGRARRRRRQAGAPALGVDAGHDQGVAGGPGQAGRQRHRVQARPVPSTPTTIGPVMAGPSRHGRRPPGRLRLRDPRPRLPSPTGWSGAGWSPRDPPWARRPRRRLGQRVAPTEQEPADQRPQQDDGDDQVDELGQRVLHSPLISPLLSCRARRSCCSARGPRMTAMIAGTTRRP